RHTGRSRLTAQRDHAEELLNALRGRAGALIEYLDGGPLETCVDRVNTEFALPLMSKLPSERLPTNERNLTDARTRIGLLLEYSLQLPLQSPLGDVGVAVHRLSYVVANRYPDLAIRTSDSEVLFRLEVKALELVSEEKSANFDALVREIHPDRDLLCVIV